MLNSREERTYSNTNDPSFCPISQLELTILFVPETHMERPVVIWSSQTAPQELFYCIVEFCSGLLKYMAKKVEYLVHPFLPIPPFISWKRANFSWVETANHKVAADTRIYSPSLSGAWVFLVWSTWMLRRKNLEKKKIIGRYKNYSGFCVCIH